MVFDKGLGHNVAAGNWNKSRHHADDSEHTVPAVVKNGRKKLIEILKFRSPNRQLCLTQTKKRPASSMKIANFTGFSCRSSAIVKVLKHRRTNRELIIHWHKVWQRMTVHETRWSVRHLLPVSLCCKTRVATFGRGSIFPPKGVCAD